MAHPETLFQDIKVTADEIGIRRIGTAELWKSLKEGYEDFNAKPSFGIFLVVIYPLVALLLTLFVDGRNPRGSLIHFIAQSGDSFFATERRSGPAFGTSSPEILWQPVQPNRSTIAKALSMRAPCGTRTSCAWHFRQAASTCCFGSIGSSQWWSGCQPYVCSHSSCCSRVLGVWAAVMNEVPRSWP